MASNAKEVISKGFSSSSLKPNEVEGTLHDGFLGSSLDKLRVKGRVRLSLLLIAAFLLTIILPGTLSGQISPGGLDPTGRSGEPPPGLLAPKDLPKPSPPPQILAPVQPQPNEKRAGLPVIRVFVREIRVVGNTVFSDAELQEITKNYEGRELITEDLEELRQALTLLYVKNGYVNSGAVIPDQSVTQGTITFHIIEGTLNDITVEGTTHFLPFYLEKRLRLNAGPPLNLNPLRERLQLLLQDPRLQRLNAELKPGLRPGESVLHLRVEEASPYQAWLEFNNFQSPTVGAERGLATVMHQNLLGLGDVFTFTFGRSEGIDPTIETSYVLPVTVWDTTLRVGYRRNDFSVIGTFEDLNIESESEIFELTLRHPIYRTPTQEFALAITGEYLQNKTLIDGFPFPFAVGADHNGVTTVSALRVTQEWIDRRPDRVIALRSRFSLGLDVLDATTLSKSDFPAGSPLAEEIADSQFFAWLGQAQWAQRVEPWGIQVVSHMDLQLANDHLFPLEQFAVGGRFSVRGYRENERVRDNAFLFSIESRVPVWHTALGDPILYLAPFLDFGRSWNTNADNPGTKTLASVGVGLRASIPIFERPAQANLYWGVPLNHITPDDDDGNLQNHGLHVQFVMPVL